MLKRIAGPIVGIIVCGLVIYAIEELTDRLFPGARAAAIAGDLASVPTGALVTVVAAWTVGALVGGVVATRIAERRWAAWIVAAFVVISVAVNATVIPHPAWMLMVGIILPLLAGWIASRTGPPTRAAAA